MKLNLWLSTSCVEVNARVTKPVTIRHIFPIVVFLLYFGFCLCEHQQIYLFILFIVFFKRDSNLQSLAIRLTRDQVRNLASLIWLSQLGVELVIREKCPRLSNIEMWAELVEKNNRFHHLILKQKLLIF